MPLVDHVVSALSAAASFAQRHNTPEALLAAWLLLTSVGLLFVFFESVLACARLLLRGLALSVRALWRWLPRLALLALKALSVSCLLYAVVENIKEAHKRDTERILRHYVTLLHAPAAARDVLGAAPPADAAERPDYGLDALADAAVAGIRSINFYKHELPRLVVHFGASADAGEQPAAEPPAREL